METSTATAYLRQLFPLPTNLKAFTFSALLWVSLTDSQRWVSCLQLARAFTLRWKTTRQHFITRSLMSTALAVLQTQHRLIILSSIFLVFQHSIGFALTAFLRQTIAPQLQLLST